MHVLFSVLSVASTTPSRRCPRPATAAAAAAAITCTTTPTMNSPCLWTPPSIRRTSWACRAAIRIRRQAAAAAAAIAAQSWGSNSTFGLSRLVAVVEGRCWRPVPTAPTPIAIRCSRKNHSDPAQVNFSTFDVIYYFAFLAHVNDDDLFQWFCLF